MTKNIQQAVTEVMKAVGAVRKAERNTAQNFNFRGIDAVVNAVSPAMRDAGLIVNPVLQSVTYDTVEVGQKRTPMGHVRVVVGFTFTAPDGSNLTAVVAAEAMDSGDKATAKAMSVAFRTALLQTFVLPTDDTDPDAESYERAPAAAAPTVKIGSRAAAPPAEPNSVSTGPFTRSQFILADKQATKNGYAGLVQACAIILGRPVNNLTDLTNEQAHLVLQQLFNKEEA